MLHQWQLRRVSFDGHSRHRRWKVISTGMVFTQTILLLCTGCPMDQDGMIPLPDEEATTIALELVADGLTSPVGMAVPPDGSGRLFIVDQDGQIHILDPVAGLVELPFLDLSMKIVSLGARGPGTFDERGLLSLSFHPGYAENGRFFVAYNAPKDIDDPEDFDSELRISEFRVSADDPNRADSDSERLLLDINKPQFNHNGGQLAFGPDGFLYISVGDGGSANDIGVGHTTELGNGQDKSKLLGKLLRIDVDGGDPFGVPLDNPFIDDPEARSEIWALGLRNPWRFSFDAGGDRRLFLADVGQDLFEEVHIIERGGNYGWNIKEATRCFDSEVAKVPLTDCPVVDADEQPLIDPIVEYPHEASSTEPQGIAVIGGYVYRGDAIPELQGQYVFGDWSRGPFGAAPDGSIFAARENEAGDWDLRELAVANGTNSRFGRYVLAFGQDADGEIYVLSTQNLSPTGTTGQVHRIVPSP